MTTPLQFPSLQSLIKPAKLNPGDKVAVATTSWGGPETFPYRFEIGKERLEKVFGLKVVPTKHALRDAAWLSQNPETRATDLMEAFSDSSIKGIISAIGGSDSIRLLPFVDLDVIRNNPKVFIGYSDTASVHFMCLKAGLRSFYGPSVMAGFAENVAMHDYTVEGVRKVLFSNDPIGQIPENTEGWTVEMLNWADPANQKIQRKLNQPAGWKFGGGDGASSSVARGRLIGGCLEVLQGLSGTELWPDKSVWESNVLFVELADGLIRGPNGSAAEGADRVARFMRNLAAQGILASLNGILFGRPGGQYMTATQLPAYEQAILQIFDEYKLPRVPIVSRMDFGHSDPMWTLPYGALVEIDCGRRAVSVLESGVR